MISPASVLSVLPRVQRLKMGPAMAGQVARVWADEITVHVTIGGQLARTVPSSLDAEDLAELRMRGAAPAGQPPAMPAPRRPGRRHRDRGQPDRRRQWERRHGRTQGQDRPGTGRSKVPLRLDGHLLRVIRNGVLAKTLPSPVPAGDRTRLRGGRIADAAEDLHKPASDLRFIWPGLQGLTEADHTDTAADRGRSWLTVHQFLHLPEPNPSARVVEPTRPVRLTDADKRFMWR